MNTIAGAVCLGAKNILRRICVLLPLAVPVAAPLIVPPAAYSQYLEPGDIAILVDNWDLISGAIESEGETEEEEPAWEAFDRRGARVVSCFEEMSVEDGDSVAFVNFRNAYEEFMAAEAPPSLRRTFEAVGWKRRGLQKMFTILFGMMFIVVDEASQEYRDGEAGGNSRALKVIDKADRKIIEDNMEKIMGLM